MYKYYCLNPISKTGLEGFSENYQEATSMEEADILLVRSAKMTDMEIPSSVIAIARAGAGVNNIPVDACADQGIVVFNTPGANANGVKELVIAGMLLASRDIVGGINWVKENQENEEVGKLAEKQKKAYAGCEISGKKLGIIGLGAIGSRLANDAVSLGMEVYGYDPFLSVDVAWNLSHHVHHSTTVEEIYSECDYITIHVPLTDDTREMINQKAIEQMKEGVVVLNFARDLLVEEPAMVEALKSGKVARYVTDFATPAIVQAPHTLVTPHLGASTAEAEENCAVMAVQQLCDYVENGNIQNSVNFSGCSMGLITAPCRVAVIHQNVPNMISQFTRLLGDLGINIPDLTNKSRGDYGYVLMDLDREISEDVADKLRAIEGVSRVRLLKPSV